MRWLAAPVILAMLGLTGCGSGLTAHPSQPAVRAPALGSLSTATNAAAPPSRSATYKLVLKGTIPASAHAPVSHASIAATIRILGPQGKLCWSFSKVRGVKDPTAAHINVAATLPNQTDPIFTVGAPQLRLGTGYSTSGCTGITPGLASQLVTPSQFFVVVDSTNYPNDGLRALLSG